MPCAMATRSGAALDLFGPAIVCSSEDIAPAVRCPLPHRLGSPREPAAHPECAVFATAAARCGFDREIRVDRAAIPLLSGGVLRICAVPNFARACGRVPVGGHPVNCRTAARGLKGSMVARVDPYGRHPGGNTGPRQQPAAGGETGEPRSPRGTQLKATTNGLFWSRRPSKGRHRRGLFLFARRAVGVLPSNPRQLPGALRPPGSTRLQSAWVRATHRPLTPATRWVVTSTARPQDGRSRTRAGRRP